MNEPKSTPPNPLHPQAKALGRNKFNKTSAEKHPLTKALDDIAALKNEKPAPAPVPGTRHDPKTDQYFPTLNETDLSPTTFDQEGALNIAKQAAKPVAPPKPVAAKAPPVPAAPPKDPGKDKSYFELTVKINDSDACAPFVVEVPLTGNGANDKANATAVARKRYPGKSMTILNSRIYTKTEGALTEISPGSTLSSLFGATGGTTEDLIEVGRAFYDGSRGTLFLRNMRSHVGLTFRPGSGGLAVFSNRIVSNRLASELPLIVAEILGNNAREIEIYLKP